MLLLSDLLSVSVIHFESRYVLPPSEKGTESSIPTAKVATWQWAGPISRDQAGASSVRQPSVLHLLIICYSTPPRLLSRSCLMHNMIMIVRILVVIAPEAPRNSGHQVRHAGSGDLEDFCSRVSGWGLVRSGPAP